MSHFSVLVVGDNIKEQLAPYQENNMGDCPQEYLEFIEDNDCDSINVDTGKRGYWSNPNSKWDWYQIGGRFSDFLKTKEGYCNQALKKDILFDEMRDIAIEKASIEYNKILNIIGDNIKSHITWKKMRNEIYKNDIDRARTEYNLQPSVKKIRSNSDYFFFNIDEIISYTLEEYITIAKKSALATFAILKDDIWYENGNMGWFGIVTNETDKNQWYDKCNDIIESCKEDDIFTIIDCHV